MTAECLVPWVIYACRGISPPLASRKSAKYSSNIQPTKHHWNGQVHNRILTGVGYTPTQSLADGLAALLCHAAIQMVYHMGGKKNLIRVELGTTPPNLVHPFSNFTQSYGKNTVVEPSLLLWEFPPSEKNLW